jgi:hypothetical protein
MVAFGKDSSAIDLLKLLEISFVITLFHRNYSDFSHTIRDKNFGKDVNTVRVCLTL